MASYDRDYLLAIEMQKRFNAEDGDSDEDTSFKKPLKGTAFKNALSKDLIISKKPLNLGGKYRSNLDDEFLNRTQNLVHPQWETLDPTPDITALFGQFDMKFFQHRLKCVTLEWSKRMYSCAGICYSRRNRYGMDITIRLSEPLLKLRPRKDLVETLLHEMIHAYCFVLNIREGNGGHGPHFKKIMGHINTVAGTNITVYHTFHDEVNLYKQHIWRCNGACQDRSPFFGYVKRTSNRAPGPNDQWWSQHLSACGGTFLKVGEPEKKTKSTNKKAKQNTKQTAAAGDLRKFFTPKVTAPTIPKSGSSNSNINGFGDFNNGFKGPVKTNGGGTMLLNPKTKTSTVTPNSSIAKAFPPSSYPGLSSDPFNTNSSTPAQNNRGHAGAVVPPGGNLRNVIGFKDLGGGQGGGGNSGRVVSGAKTISPAGDWGRGSSLTSTTSYSSNTSSPEEKVDRKHLRDLWAKRFADGDKPNGDSKRRRISNEDNSSSSRSNSSNNTDDVIFIADENKSTVKNSWIVVNDDIMLQEDKKDIITLSSDDDDDDDDNSDTDTKLSQPKISKNMTFDERQIMIKKEIIDESIDLCNDDIELIDDEYDDNGGASQLDITIAAELADTKIIDEFFGEDTLMKEFKRENDCKIASTSKNALNKLNDIITCPICLGKMTRSVMAEHLNGCTGIAVVVKPRRKALKKLASISKEALPPRRSRVSQTSNRAILLSAGYTEADLVRIAPSNIEDDEEEREFLNRSLGRSPNNRSVHDLNSSLEDESIRGHKPKNVYKTTRQCPVCSCQIEETEMNEHLDECLG